MIVAPTVFEFCTNKPVVFTIIRENIRLALRFPAYSRTAGTINAEERVKPSTVDEDVGGGDDAKTTRYYASCGGAEGEASGEFDFVIGGANRKRGGSLRIRLVMGHFGLDLAYEDVCRARELVLIDRLVLGCRTDEPENANYTFYIETAAYINSNLNEI